MNVEGIDIIRLSKLLSSQFDHITCIECCKYYIAPETAACGHTLCHKCWRGRKICPHCNAPVERRQTKLNMPMQKLTEHIQTLGASYEKLFNTTLEDFLLNSGEAESENDPAKNIMEWLTSSQNHFSAPAQSSDRSSQDMFCKSNPIHVPPSNIQVHAPSKKTKSPEKVLHASLPQDDWDKIEVMPAIDLVEKNKENIVGLMDIEPFYLDDNEYNVAHPRRSSRKRELKSNDVNINNNSTLDKENTKDSSGDMDKKSNSAKQNWNNVKKMKKEFSKLNKLNRNKLNVSIEMCKKTQSSTKAINALHNVNTPQVYDIDENTPKQTLTDLPQVQIIPSDHKIKEQNDIMQNFNDNNPVVNQTSNMSQSLLDKEVTTSITHEEKELKLPNHEPDVEYRFKSPFYKKSALCTTQSNQVEDVMSKTTNHNIESNTNSNEDIEIIIKVGNTITNIIIKKKNDVQIKVNTDREVQTSLEPQHAGVLTPQKIETRNVSINIDSNNEVNIEHKQLSKDNVSIPSLLQGSHKSSVKKNTPSADTGTGPFEITESVEKELSNIMECAEMEDQQKTKSVPSIVDTNLKKLQKHQSISDKSQKIKTPTLPLNKSQRRNTPTIKNTPVSIKNNAPDGIDVDAIDCSKYDDIFKSDCLKENVKLLQNTKNNTPSEILTCTAQNRYKTQKEKRDRDNDKEDLPLSKKQKLNENNTNTEKLTIISKQSNKIQPDSEPMNYDSIMGHVFANIDADMEEIKSQNIDQKLSDSHHDTNQSSHKTSQVTQKNITEKDIESEEYDIIANNEFGNPKDSENMFSVCIEKDAIEASVPKNDQADIEPQANLEDFLTPVMPTNRESSSVAFIEINNDDSESVVEDTPQKDTSFGMPKPKSIISSSQRLKPIQPRVPGQSESDKKIVNLVDTTDMQTTNDVTVIETARKTLETPLTINKFVNHIKHNSTPVARKSLTFDTEEDMTPEQTLCPTNVVKTTQEKEFLKKAFDKTPTLQVVKPLSRPNVKNGKKFCIAGSCLSSNETASLKGLCAQYKWSYVDRYDKNLTHLVVGVNEEKRSQRSVKYMCALAASKWIVTSEWVERCLETKTVVGEEKFEALDSSGEPGPRRSRVANNKLFQGLSFYCMEPFSVLDVDTLKEILESSGGRVVNEVKEVRVTDKSSGPAILLAEPENTQEDRFIYLAMELGIVPVNYEWVLNCLGSYTISSIQELLLCPASLLPKATERWPLELIAREDDL